MIAQCSRYCSRSSIQLFCNVSDGCLRHCAIVYTSLRFFSAPKKYFLGRWTLETLFRQGFGLQISWFFLLQASCEADFWTYKVFPAGVARRFPSHQGPTANLCVQSSYGNCDDPVSPPKWTGRDPVIPSMRIFPVRD